MSRLANMNGCERVSSLKEECRHIFSYSEGVDEAWLNYEPLHPADVDICFNFCPLCGEELILWGAE